MDYEAEIAELKQQVAALQEQVRLIMSAHPKLRICGLVDSESRHNGLPILPAGLRMALRDDGRYAPCEDRDTAIAARLVDSIRMTNHEGTLEDKIAAMELCR